jgi:Cdc6-like AAA superfamily ATPase
MTPATTSSTLLGMATTITRRYDVEQDEKVRENRLRRMAERQGLRLEKSRRRDPRAIDYGMYTLVDPNSNAIVAGAEGTGRPNFSLDDVEAFLTSDERANEVRRRIRENLPSGTAMKRVDAEAIEAWIKRNPDATVEDIVQIVHAPDHFLELITREGEEDWPEKKGSG